MARLSHDLEFNEEQSSCWRHFASEVSSWNDICSIAAAETWLLGLKYDGTAVSAVFDDPYDDFPNYAPDVSFWHDVVAITAGESLGIGIKKDGTVVLTIPEWRDMWGGTIARLYGLKAIQKASVADIHWYDYSFPVVMSTDGHVYINTDSSSQVEDSFSDFFSSGWLTVGLRKDGTASLLSANDDIDWESTKRVIDSWSDLKQIVCGDNLIVGLNNDKTIVYYMPNNHYNYSDLDSWQNIEQLFIAPNSNRVAGIRTDGTAVAMAGVYVSSPDSSDADRDDEGWDDDDWDDDDWDDETSFFTELSMWSDMKSLLIGDYYYSYYIVGLRNDGRVLFAYNSDVVRIDLPSDDSVLSLSEISLP